MYAPCCRGNSVRTWALDVSNDASRRIVHELDAHLCDTTTRAWLPLAMLSYCLSHVWPTSSAEDAGDFDELDGLLLRIHGDEGDVVLGSRG